MHDRLTKSGWIRHGLRTLAKDGPNALKVGPMSTKLKVSRGSFYWHFRDRPISGRSYCEAGKSVRRIRSFRTSMPGKPNPTG
jgi:hypothetical protein